MKFEKKELPKSQIEITFELTAEELKPFLEKTAVEISNAKNIKGFRPGKAPFDVVVKEVGEMTVYQTAANNAVEKTYYETVEKEKVDAVDQPKIEIVKLAPGNPFIFKATISILPEIKICDYTTIKVSKLPEIKIEESEIEKILKDLQKMKQKEILDDKTIEAGDKVEITFDTFVDNVPIEGGKSEKHAVVIGSEQMIPGFEDNLVGLKKDTEKEFELSFPKKYHAEKLAGKKASFKIKVLAVYKIELPKINDEFAVGMGMKKLDDLKKNIKSNITQEKEIKAKQKQELELIEKLISQSTFGELPENLIDQETHKMIHELQENLEKQGMQMTDYLNHMKKTEAQLRLDFVPDAIKRVKTGLLIRTVAKKEAIEVTDAEVSQETEKALASYKLNPAYAQHLEELEKNIKSENGKHYFKNLLTNRKTIEKLKKLIIK